ncbi:MAG: 50S ribosomal protein L9 [Lachnospiraceae bacterium]|nr:50S ribosomal protein L9 [Lachnospiraceae bacterium]MBO4762863.1 50S ribosomal protein L9 [Lachnospiraceae bacterium]MBR5367648.1 50S ribosomal protein L9 [Lachnospiraceae bacterium]
MQIILLADVKSLGKEGEVVKVSDGYARNFILPKKLGVEATPKNMEELKERQALEAQRRKEIFEEAKAFGEKLSAASVKLSIKGGQGGRTFGAVTAKEISAGIKEQLGYDVDKKKIVLAENLKNAGIYNVTIKLHPDVSIEMKVEIEVI